MYLFSNLKSCILFALLIIFSSCSQLRYTDYGKPLDFLKSNRVANKKIVINNEVIADEKEKTELLSNQTYTLPVNTLTKIELPKQAINTVLLEKDSKVLSQSKVGKKPSNILIQERPVNPLLNSLSLIENYNKDQKQAAYDEVDDVVLMILCVIIPPLAVFFSYDISNEFWIDLLLTLLFFLPGIIYALYVCFLR